MRCMYFNIIMGAQYILKLYIWFMLGYVGSIPHDVTVNSMDQ